MKTKQDELRPEKKREEECREDKGTGRKTTHQKKMGC